MACAAESCGARETERDRFCSADAGAIDAAEGGPAHNAGGTVYPRCIIWLDAFVCWSLRCLCDRVESHGRRSLLLCPSTYTPLLPRGGQCVRACNHSPQQDQHQTTISSSAAASSPCILALALACSSGQTPYLQLAGRLSLQISHTSSSTASTIPPCTEM